MSGARVVVVGPIADATLESRLQQRGHEVCVAEGLRHAIMLQRVFLPDVVLLPRAPDEKETGLLATSATRPVVIIAALSAADAIRLIGQGISRVVPPSSPSSPSSLEGVLGLSLARERPVVRALAQLSLLKATGALLIGLADSDGPSGEIVVDNGAVFEARSGNQTGSQALATLAALDAPVFFLFEEANQFEKLPQASERFIDNDDDVDRSVNVDVGVNVNNSRALDLPAVSPLELFDIDLDVTDTGVAPRAAARHEPTAFDVDLADSGLPALSGTPAPGPVVEAAPAPTQPAPRCLIVEDDHDLARMYGIHLKAKGFDVDVAYDGEEGFAAAQASRHDVILSDIMMPKVTGWDLLGLIRNNARLRETPFLLLSHHRELVRTLKNANGGADGYLEKSLRPELVVASVIAAVKPMRDLEAAMLNGDERVDGMLAGIGPQTLLRLCERHKLTGRMALRPPSQRFLIGLEEGFIVDAQCSMGSATLRHRDALRALLLVDDGPFTFLRGAVTASAPRTALPPLLDELCDELERLLDDLRTGVLLSGQPLKMRPELFAVYRASAPPSSIPLLDLLAAGGSPRDLIGTGDVDLVLVDGIVRDLFRKGVIAP
ncbi:MAG: response regulator [Deltaproteobacteria bacterium]|nr:response regulator [Deltaproteobacteria bacterium]